MMQEQKVQPEGAWTPKETKAVERLVLCLKLRSLVLKRGDGEGMSLDNMKAVTNGLSNQFWNEERDRATDTYREAFNQKKGRRDCLQDRGKESDPRMRGEH